MKRGASEITPSEPETVAEKQQETQVQQQQTQQTPAGEQAAEQTSGEEPAKRTRLVSLAEKFAPPANTWRCSTCMVSNASDARQCMACESPNPNASASALSSATAASAAPKFVFGTFGGAAAASSSSSSSTSSSTTSSTTSAPTFSFTGLFGKPAAATTTTIAPAASSSDSASTSSTSSSTSTSAATSSSTTSTFSFSSASFPSFGTAFSNPFSSLVPNFSFGSSTPAATTFSSIAASKEDDDATELEGGADGETVSFTPGSSLPEGSGVSELFKNRSQESAGDESDVVLARYTTKVFRWKEVPRLNAEGVANGTEMKWVEHGVGELHLNTYVPSSSPSQSSSDAASTTKEDSAAASSAAAASSGDKKARLIMRTEKTRRLVLNVPVVASLAEHMQIVSERNVRFNTVENDKPLMLLLKVKTKEEAANLLEDLLRLVKEVQKKD